MLTLRFGFSKNNRKPSNDDLRLFHLFRTGSAPGVQFISLYAMEPLLSGVYFFVSSGSDHTHSLHVLLLIAILDGRPVIGDDAVVVPRIVE